MSRIDWSKAPAGCLEVGKNKWDELAWLCADGYIYHHCDGCMVKWRTPRALKRSDFDVVDIRPDQEWNGEGLPPVGTMCEWKEKTGFSWVQATVLFITDSSVVMQREDGFEWQMMTARTVFRPFRTPEQIAADDRLHEIRNALSAIHASQLQSMGDSLVVAAVEAMIDAGYRKQVTL